MMRNDYLVCSVHALVRSTWLVYSIREGLTEEEIRAALCPDLRPNVRLADAVGFAGPLQDISGGRLCQPPYCGAVGP